MGILVKVLERHYAKKEKRKTQPGPYWCEIYKVRGVNPTTKRKKTNQVIAASNAPSDLIQEKSGLLPPYEIEKVTRPASDLQLETMRKYGFKPPVGLSMWDASIFITRSVEGEPLEQSIASLAFVDYAIENNVYIPKYANTKEAREYLLTALPDKTKEINELN